jgi:lysozyme
MERGPNTLSDAGVKALIKVEGVRHEVYIDTAGHPTIGVGHKIIANDKNLCEVTGMPDSSMVRELTGEQVQKLLFLDLETYEKGVLLEFDFDLPQHIFDALVLFCFNLGVRAFTGASFIPFIKNKQYSLAYSVIMQYNKTRYKVNGKTMFRTSPGLLKRRFVEVGIMSYPFVPPKCPAELSKPLFENALDIILDYYADFSRRV